MFCETVTFVTINLCNHTHPL